MYSNAAYLIKNTIEVIDRSQPFLVTACGYVRIEDGPTKITCRPNGRGDYQLLYVASGRAHFFIGGKDCLLPHGHAVLFRPGEPQMYRYYSQDQTEVCWVHFTGYDVENILSSAGIPDTGNVFFTGSSPDYPWLYRQIRQELQLRRARYEQLLPLLLRHIFLMIGRSLSEGGRAGHDVWNEIEHAVHDFNENYNRDINVEAYAREHNMSVSWFIRNFREQIKVTPMRYLVELRIANAKNLLETTRFNVSEIAQAVGYDNALYFSRLFRKYTGLSPTEYRRSLHTADTESS